MKTTRIQNISIRFIVGVTMIFFLGAISCNDSTPQKNPIASSPKKNVIIRKPGSSYTDTIMITSRSAVFYSPDSLQMTKIKTVNEKNIFAMITHDCHFQMENARTVLKKYWPGVKIVEACKERYLLFVKQDKTKICIDLNDKNDICGLFLFDPHKNPVLVDMPNIDTELGFYFVKRSAGVQ